MQKQYEMNQYKRFKKEDFEPVPIDRKSMTIVDQVEPAQSFADDRSEIEALLFDLFASTSERNEKDNISIDMNSLASSSTTIYASAAARPHVRQNPPDFIDSDFWTEDDSSSTTASFDSGQKVAASTSVPTTTAVSASTNSFAKFRKHHPENWMKRYRELTEYRRKYGHCVVDVKKYGALARWVKRQRHQYKRKQEGGHTTLVDDRQELLENIGFIWDTHDASWEQRFNELVEYKKQYGHTNVPGIYPANRALGIWVKSQRKQYLDDLNRRFANSNQATIRETRYRSLENIGFQWVLRPR